MLVIAVVVIYICTHGGTSWCSSCNPSVLDLISGLVLVIMEFVMVTVRVLVLLLVSALALVLVILVLVRALALSLSSWCLSKNSSWFSY